MYFSDDIKNVHLEPSSLCNARCPVCPRYEMGGEKNNTFIEHAISLNEFKSWFSPKFINQLNSIIMCGNFGDPCTTPDLVDIVYYIQEHNPTISLNITTNGGMRNQKFWEDLGNAIKDNKDAAVVFSIDGLRDTNHIYRRGVDWNKLEANIKAFRSTGAKARWEFLVFKHNEHQIEEAEQLSRDWGFIDIRFKWKPFGFTSNRNTTLVYDKDGNFEYEIFKRGVSNAKIKLLPELQIQKSSDMVYIAPEEMPTQYIKLQSNSISCQSQRLNEIYVSSIGQVYPCCFLSSIWYYKNKRWEDIQFIDLIKEHYDELNLNNSDLDTILGSDFFHKKIVNGFKKGNDRTIHCSKWCGVK